MSTVELVYARGSMFGRDLFHYGLSAVVFCFCALSPFLLQSISLSRIVTPVDLTLDLGAWEKTVLTVCVVFLSYALGQLLLVIGFVYRALWKRMFKKRLSHVRNLVQAEEKVKELVSQDSSGMRTVSSYPHDFHVFCEISAFSKLPDAHAKFIERYNTLAFLRLSLSSSMLTGGLICMSLLKITCMFYVYPMVTLWEITGIMLLRQHFITQTGFLNRVAVTYILGKESKE